MLPDNILFHHRRSPPLPSSKNAAATILPFSFLTKIIVIYYITDGVQKAIGGAESNCPNIIIFFFLFIYLMFFLHTRLLVCFLFFILLRS